MKLETLIKSKKDYEITILNGAETLKMRDIWVKLPEAVCLRGDVRGRTADLMTSDSFRVKINKTRKFFSIEAVDGQGVRGLCLTVRRGRFWKRAFTKALEEHFVDTYLLFKRRIT